MQIGDILNTYNNNLSMSTGSAPSEVAEPAKNASVPNGTKGVEQLVNTTETLQKGNIFEGTINSVDGNKVTIGLSNGQTISARLDSGVSLSDGQSVFFQVKNNDGGVVQIKPVSTDLNGNPTLTNALNTASLAVNERTLNMVNTMMKEQMPIDVASLNNMNRILINNPDINPATIVTMTKLGLPMDIEMANQFENYQTNQAQISKDLQAVVDSIPTALTDSSLTASQTVELNNNLLAAFGIEPSEAVQQEVIEDEAVMASETAEQGVAQTQNGPEQANSLGQTNNPEQANSLENADNTGQPDKLEQPNIIEQSKNIVQSNNVSEQANGFQEQPNASATQSSWPEAINTVLTDKNYNALNNAIKNLPDIGQAEPGLFNDKGELRKDLSPKDVLSAIMDYTSKTENIPKEKLDSLFGTNAYKKLINNVAEKSWTIKPEDIAKKDEVEKLYERILRQTDDILAASERAGKATSELSKAANEVKSNVNFMNQVNEMYNFVQLPVKLSDQTANSDLYVFQNKKKNFQESDELTAFLHFDLEHLGSTDINVRMKQKNVSCDWTLEKEDSLALIEANLDKLEARLNAKGYNCSFTAKGGQNDFNFVDDFLKQDVKPAGIVHRYSFDMKA